MILGLGGWEDPPADRYTLRVTKNRAKGCWNSAARHGDRAHAMAGSAELFEGVDLEFEDVKPAGKPSNQQICTNVLVTLGATSRASDRTIGQEVGHQVGSKHFLWSCSGCVQSKMTGHAWERGAASRRGPIGLATQRPDH